MATDFYDDKDSTLGINQLDTDEQFVSADDALAQDINDVLEDENKEEWNGLLTSHIVQTIQERYEYSKRQRDSDEKRWLDAYRNFRGLYSKNIKFSEQEKSRIFVKVTKTKVVAAYGQLVDVLFGTDKFPISIKSTKVPEGAEEYIHFTAEGAPTAEGAGVPANALTTPEPEVSPYDVGFEGDGMEVPKGAKFSDITQGLKKLLRGKGSENQDRFAKGAGPSGEPTFTPARDAAMRMEKLIHDQIQESNGAQELRSAMFEAALLGTGIVKGPFTVNKTLHRWSYDPETKKREYTPQTVKVPRIEFVSIFDSFPDPNADVMDECEWFIQRHKMSKSNLRALKNRPYFDVDRINQILDLPPNYVREDYENEILAENSSNMPNQDRYEVLEYWGVMSVKDLKKAGMQFGEEYSNIEEVQINAWTCYGKLIRVVLNPFTPKRIPYLAFCYERDPYNFFGVGVAENMSDSQQIMNGHMRMAIDNLRLAGNMVFDVDENALVPGQSMEIYAGKMFKRAAGAPGQAVFGIKFPNTAPENMQIFDKFRQIADESTGIPSYAHGQTGVMSTTRTAAGMSMLMGAASLNVKTVVKNIDDFLLKPLGEAMFQWNMSFYEGEIDIVGDLEVQAGGAASLMQNEIRSQRLTAFGQLLGNPAIAPWIKIPQYIREFVKSLELDPEEFINDQEQAAVYAQLIGAAGGLGGGSAPAPGSGMGQVGGVPAPAMPGEEAFSASPQEVGPTENQ